ncbi:MAG: hypothetical protein N2692_00135 [Patescibacteria group bacterium]|jgi:hypothetical protein|nr:hypothetical protein [Patescibacteria group bacterium]
MKGGEKMPENIITLEELESYAIDKIVFIKSNYEVGSSCEEDIPDNQDGCCGDTDSCGEYPPNSY